MGLLGDLSATLRLTGAPAMVGGLQNVGRAASSLTGILSSVQGPLALLGVSFAALKSAEGAVGALKDIFATGRELQTLSRISGQSVRDLVVLRKAFTAAGLDAGAVPSSLRLMQRAIGGVNEEGEPTAFIFKQLGLNIASLKGQTAIEQLTAIGAAIRKLPDQTSQAAAAMKIFSRSGGDMLAVFSDPSILGNAGANAGAMADIYQKSAATFSKISLDLQMLSGKVKGFFVGMAGEIAPVILPWLEKLKKIDLTGLGQQVGGAMKMIASAFEQGKIGELVGGALQLGGMKFVNFMSGAIVGIGQGLGAAAAVWMDVWEKLPGMIDAMDDGLIGSIQTAGAMLLEVFQKPIVAFQAGLQYAMEGLLHQLGQIPTLGSMMGLDQFEAPDFEKIRADREKEGASFFGAGVGDLAAKGQDSMERMRTRFSAASAGLDIGGSVRGIMEEIRAGVKAGGGVFSEADMGKLQTSLTGLMAGLNKSIEGSSGALAKAGGTLAVGAGGGGKVEGDRLAKIGGFIGGSGGPSLDYARRTAVSNEKMVTILKDVQRGLSKSNPLAAVWAP